MFYKLLRFLKDGIVRPFFAFSMKAGVYYRRVHIVRTFFSVLNFFTYGNFPHYQVVKGFLLFLLAVVTVTIDSCATLDILDGIRDFIYGKSNTIDIKSDVPVLPSRESVVITPELEKAIAVCNKEGYSVVQASPDTSVPSTSSRISLASILSLVIIVGFFMLDLKS